MQFKFPIFQQLRLGVRQRLVLTLLGGLLISLTINIWFSLREQERYTHDEIDRNGRQLSLILSRSLANAVVGYDYHGIQLFIEEVNKGDIEYIVVTSKKGNTMAQTGNVVAAQEQVRVFTSDILLQGNVVGHIRIGLNTQAIIDKIEAQKGSLLIREAGVVIFLLIIEFLALSLLIVRPLARISNALSKNPTKNGILPAEIEIHSHDEFGDIATKFNSLRTQLNTAHEALQGMVDVADQRLRKANEELMKKSQELEDSNRILKDQAVTDPLTGLFNRRRFQTMMKDDVSLIIDNGGVMSLIIADIDHFKNINDKFGHEVGDQVLQEVARRLSDNVRKSDVLCRIGGEEFALFCYRADQHDALGIAEKLRKCIAETPISIEDANLIVTISLGLATPGVGRYIHCPDCLYRQADIALYQSKSNGRNRVTHFCEVDLSAVEGLDMEELDASYRA